ncbi:MAG: DUF6514 family protein [Clostridiales bacterium]|jgi:hypothetical protein|nr:DUF6514 family protein [Clostridiales bacterium]
MNLENKTKQNFMEGKVESVQKEFFKMMSTKRFRLEYYVLRNEFEVDEFKVTTYGVEIIKKQRKKDVVTTEVKTARNVCTSEQQIRKLVELLSENLVTPVTLKDIIDDLIEDKKISSPQEQSFLNSLAVV